MTEEEVRRVAEANRAAGTWATVLPPPDVLVLDLSDPLQEARVQLRDRLGRWVDMPDRPPQDDYTGWKAWQTRMTQAVTHGAVSPAEAHRRGWASPGGARGGHEGYKPLPRRLYHVTTAASKVAKSGGLKTCEELGMTTGTGLGGGQDDTISLTDDREHAERIRRSMLRAREAVLGEYPLAAMIEDAKAEGFYDEWLKYNDGHEPSEPTHLHEGLADLKRLFSDPPTAEQLAEHGLEPEDGDPGREWEGKTIYLRARRPVPQDTLQQHRLMNYARWSRARQFAGGEKDAIFLGSDASALARTDPAEIALLTLEPEEGAVGYEVPYEHEWRVHAGDALRIVDGPKPEPAQTGARFDTTAIKDGPAHDAARRAQDALAKVIDLDRPVVIENLSDDDPATARSLPTGNLAIHADSSEKFIATALVHEMAHLLDRAVMGTEDDWLTQREEFSPLYDTFRESTPFKALRADEVEVMKGDDRGRASLLQGRELLARAFEQWVAVRSQDPVLLDNLRKTQADDLLSFQFWTDEEFGPISVELERILRAHSLLRSLQEAAHDEGLHPRNRLGQWIEKLGIPAFKVGGAVRDPMLGKTPKDEDYMLMAAPEAIRAAVEREGGVAEPLVVRDRLVGIRAHVPGITPPEGVELAPPRVEVSTGEGRHDFAIEPHPAVMGGDATPAQALADDALRRDFTVNAMFQDAATGEIVDPLGGQVDMDARQLRTTSPDSFREDPLRILRGLRFMSQHGLDLHPDTDAQMREHAGAITALTRGGVSGTARAELDKLLMGEHVGKALRTMRDTGVLASFLPELAPIVGFDQESRYHDLSLDEHIISVVENAAALGAPLDVRLAALFHDAGKPETAWRGQDGHLHFYANPDGSTPAHEDAGASVARAALNRLRYPSETVNRVTRIVQHHMVGAAGSSRPARARRWRADVGPDLAADVLLHRRADVTAKGEADPAHVEQLARFAALVADQADAPATRADLAVTGRDLIDAGVPPGPQVGERLQDLLDRVIADPSLNRRDWLLAQAIRE